MKQIQFSAACIAILNCSVRAQQPPQPEEYTFGETCGSLTQDECADVECLVCKMSWPSDSTFDDPNAQCRCETEVAPRPEPTEFTWGESCASLTAD